MTKVQSDLESLVAFRSYLHQFNSNLIEEFTTMRARYQELGTVWTDAKYHEFGHALEEASRGIARYLATTQDHEKHLYRLSEALRAFLDQTI